MLTEKNNSKRLFKERTMIDARFELVVLGLAYFVSLEMKKDLTATEYFRSEEENTAVGGGKHSAHKVGRGGDFRSRLFTVSEKALIDNYLENVWGKDFLYWIWHDSGHGEHLHLQIRYKHARMDEELKIGFEKGEGNAALLRRDPPKRLKDS